jgi:hypothetical protein
MIGIIWNCRGIAKKGMWTCIKDLLLEFKADFVGFHETMRKNIQISFLEKWIPIRVIPGTGCPQMVDLGGFFVELKQKSMK